MAFFFHLFLSIIDTLKSSYFNDSNLATLTWQIEEHNKKIIDLSETHLNPNITFSHIILMFFENRDHKTKFGALGRFEAKHREVKVYSRATNSRRNTTLSLAK